ncbi:MAG TPA: hypothetical protein VMF57_06300 [Solirubrobacteraceae bacterium]|nr:hypothetical protein [Solirubrobacteraceae bacterium]
MSTMAHTQVGSAQVRRSLDRSRRRKPLRLQITRRRAGRPAGEEKFVTQVRFGGAEAVVVPFDDSGFLTTRPAPADD